MGGELGSRVASLLEDEPWVGALEGIDVDPPRRRLRRAVFHRIVAGQHDRIVDEVTRFNPHVAGPRRGLGAPRPGQPRHRPPADRRRRDVDPRRRCRVPGARVDRRAQRDRDLRPPPRLASPGPTSAPPVDPTCEYGRMLAEIERTAGAIGRRVGVGGRRGAPGPGARPARAEPARPVPAACRRCRSARSPTRRSPSMHKYDAAEAFVAAARARLAEPVNIVAPGAITVLPGDPPRPAASPCRSSGPSGASPRGSRTCAAHRSPTTCSRLLHRGRLADNGRALARCSASRRRDHHRDVIDQAVLVAERRPRPGPRAGGVMGQTRRDRRRRHAPGAAAGSRHRCR